MKILICGMPRSMTTWAFNAVRELISRQPLRTLWIEPEDLEAENDFVTTSDHVLAKCHHYSENLAKAADIVVYSYRDLRTAAVSYHRKFGSACSRGQLEAWVLSGDAWMHQAEVVLRYETAQSHPLVALGQLRQVLVTQYGAENIVADETASVLERVDKSFVAAQATNKIVYDHRTMILPGHRTFQPSPEQLNESEKALYDRVQSEFSTWLNDHGYIQQENHGQQLDYRLAAGVLEALPFPVVVDVGAERGSFVQIALDAGAIKVVAFEPLPRHAGYLQQCFKGENGVEIRTQAVSSQTGQAQFHIALDREGHELDYHHTLSDLGDSATVIRGEKAIQVETVSLGDLLEQGQLEPEIDFLKIDTDGHDLSVLLGLGDLRPRFILAEYWDTLPESSGQNIYTLAELDQCAKAYGYERCVVIRRHGRMESLEWDATWTQTGDWGNVLFIRDSADWPRVGSLVAELATMAQRDNLDFVTNLIQECEAKEAEIRRLDNARNELRDLARSLTEREQTHTEEPQAREAEFQWLANELGDKQTENNVIVGRKRTLTEALESLKSDREQVTNTSKVHSEIRPAASKLEDGLGELKPDLRLLIEHLQSISSGLELDNQLIENEKVIRELSRALEAYRAAFGIGYFIKQPFVKLSSHFRPRLGNLNQYPPCEWRRPAPYQSRLPNEQLPTISLVTPSYKQGPYISRTLDSVLDQEYPNLEYFVQDGGSTDETVEILKSYSDRLTGWESSKDGGQSQAINLGFAKTQGEIMAWLNSDDLLLPGALARVGEYFALHPEVDVVYGHRILIDEEDKDIGRWVLPKHDDEVLKWADFIPQETLFWRRSIWEKAGGQIDEEFRFAMDWDLLLRFRKAGARMVRLPRFLGAFRIHEAQKTSSVINEVGSQEMGRLRQRELGRIVGQLEIRRALIPYVLAHIGCDLMFKVKKRLKIAGG